MFAALACLSGALVLSLALVTASQAFTATPVDCQAHVVRPGETLWEVARGIDPEADTRAVVRRLMSLNDLPTVDLVPGQPLCLP
ncbi:LysM peptidoglycan-binding domain-containing protein [Parafrankia sp. EUN1f]|uniref:LysM peptidoglycan-binding domain-containing protein n=1 Tax=Parafrankia sp. EUN1f TaxID=102897 RepID=UPI0001C4701F|nr:LysM peptidoglycan-binding domain-containing protein [Parafrankia sp. EUN1f]EFC82112.1 Peptidoglycan-binding LysM [Parafrankia sp. EUN1f]